MGCLPVERRWKPPIGRSFAGCNPFSLTIPRFGAPGLSAGLSFTPAPLTPGPLLGRGLGCQENASHLPPCPSFAFPQGDLASYRKHHRRLHGAWRDERGHKKERGTGEGTPSGSVLAKLAGDSTMKRHCAGPVLVLPLCAGQFPHGPG